MMPATRSAVRRAVVSAGLLAAAMLAGCSADPEVGYSFKSPYPETIDTVAVDIFTRGNNVYRRELEFRLTEALAKRIEQVTPYKVTDKTRADTLLSGRIDRVEQQILSTNPDTGRPRELEITYVLSYTWKDLRTGKVMVDHSNYRVAGTYIQHRTLNEEFFEGSEDVSNRAARRIVETMESDW